MDRKLKIEVESNSGIHSIELVTVPNPEECGECYLRNRPMVLIHYNGDMEWICWKCFAKRLAKEAEGPWRYLNVD